MIYSTENYLLEVDVDNGWGGTLYCLYRKEDLLNSRGLRKPAISLYSTEYEDDDRQLFNEMESFLYKDSTFPDKDLKEIMVGCIGITDRRFEELCS